METCIQTSTKEPTVELCFKERAGNSKYETVSRNTRAIRQLESHVREVLCKARVEKIRGRRTRG